MSNQILPGATATVTVPAGELLAVYSQGRAQLSQLTDPVNFPPRSSALADIDNEHYVTAVLSASASVDVVISAVGDSEVLYEVGTAPVVKQAYREQGITGTPVAVNVTGAVSSAAILGGLVTSTTAAAVAGTVPTGAVLDLAAEFAVGEGVEWSVINTGANTFTVTAASGHTLVGLATVATATVGRFLTKKTAADTFITYRIAS